MTANGLLTAAHGEQVTSGRFVTHHFTLDEFDEFDEADDVFANAAETRNSAYGR